MWSMWRSWKGDEQRRNYVGRDNARLLETLHNVVKQRDAAVKERDDLKTKLDELDEEMKTLKIQLVIRK